jgi:hypothetical protein
MIFNSQQADELLIFQFRLVVKRLFSLDCLKFFGQVEHNDKAYFLHLDVHEGVAFINCSNLPWSNNSAISEPTSQGKLVVSFFDPAAADAVMSTSLPVHISGSDGWGCQDAYGVPRFIFHRQVPTSPLRRVSKLTIEIPIVQASFTDFYKHADIFFYTNRLGNNISTYHHDQVTRDNKYVIVLAIIYHKH